MYKKVNMYCRAPFTLKGARIGGNFRNIVLDTESIKVCIEHKAKIEEILPGGRILPLGFDNFDTDNGGVKVDKQDQHSFFSPINKKEVAVIDRLHKPQKTEIKSTVKVEQVKPNTDNIKSSIKVNQKHNKR